MIVPADNRPISVDIDKIKRLREERGLTMEQAAKLAGLPSRQRWNDLEAGRKPDIRVSTLEAVAKALGVKPADLLK